MSTAKRSALIACVACVFVSAILFCLFLWAPAGPAILGVLRDIPVLLGLASLVALIALVGAIWGIVHVVQAFTHVTARLSANDSGSISIERSALVSVAVGALARIPHVAIQAVDVDVVPRRDSAVLDVEVLASPLGTDSLMALASEIQSATKRSLEAFTEHEVRYVAVRFVESRRRGESLSAGASAEAAPSAASAVPAAEPAVDVPASEAVEVSEPAVSADGAEAPAEEVVTAGDSAGKEASETPEPRASWWDRAKAGFGRLRGKVDGEQEAVYTPAEVSDAEEQVEDAADGAADAAQETEDAFEAFVDEPEAQAEPVGEPASAEPPLEPEVETADGAEAEEDK